MSWDVKTVALINVDSEDLRLLGKWVFVILLLVKIDRTVICGKAFFLTCVDEVGCPRTGEIKVLPTSHYAHYVFGVILVRQRLGADSVPIKQLIHAHIIFRGNLRLDDIFYETYRYFLLGKIVISIARIIVHYIHEFAIC